MLLTLNAKSRFEYYSTEFFKELLHFAALSIQPGGKRAK